MNQLGYNLFHKYNNSDQNGWSWRINRIYKCNMSLSHPIDKSIRLKSENNYFTCYSGLTSLLVVLIILLTPFGAALSLNDLEFAAVVTIHLEITFVITGLAIWSFLGRGCYETMVIFYLWYFLLPWLSESLDMTKILRTTEIIRNLLRKLSHKWSSISYRRCISGNLSSGQTRNRPY